MYVKRIVDKKVLDILHLAWDVFEDEVAPYYSEEGIEEFRNFIKFENIISMIDKREITFFQVLEGEELCGMSAISPDGHVFLLAINKNWRGKGAEVKLFNAMKQYCIIERRVVQMMANVSPNAVQMYQQLGFTITHPEQEKNGVCFVSMTYYIKDAKAIAGGHIPKRRNNIGRILYLVFMIGFLGFHLFGSKNLMGLLNGDAAKESESSTQIQENLEIQNNSELQGMDAIEVKIEDELPYTIMEENYTYAVDKTGGKYQMEFEVKYPQIEAEGFEKQNEINKVLEDCAMSTVNTLYLKPSENIKEAMLKLESPVLVSNVTYKVTYASSEYISVVFEDQYIAGNTQNKYIDLRARTINLSDGTVYEMDDIIELSDEFMMEWGKRMRNENPSSQALRQIKRSEFRKILQGQTLGGKYHEVFFVDKNGLQIGITYHFSNDTLMENGWTTVPFTMDEIKQYQGIEQKGE